MEFVCRYSVLYGSYPGGRVEDLILGLFGFFPFPYFVCVVFYFKNTFN